MNWEALRKARVRARKYGLDTDREKIEMKRKEFQQANIRIKRAFERNTEKLFERYPNDVLATAIEKDRNTGYLKSP